MYHPRIGKDKAAIIELMRERKFSEAADRAQAMIRDFPEDPECFVLRGVAFLNMKEHRKALKTMLQAVKRFPGDWRCAKLLGDAHAHLGEFTDAEEVYRKAIELIRTDRSAQKDDISELHSLRGHVLWELRDRDGALDAWKTAVKIDPKNEDAKAFLEECTNEYGEGKAPTQHFDDLYHFMNIQKSRYFALVGRSEFESKAEAEGVIGAIMNGWNEHITPHARRLDKMTASEKTELFRSVVLRWEKY